jgi:hypothetical protein
MTAAASPGNTFFRSYLLNLAKWALPAIIPFTAGTPYVPAWTVVRRRHIDPAKKTSESTKPTPRRAVWFFVFICYLLFLLTSPH